MTIWRPFGEAFPLGDCGCGCSRFGAAPPPNRRFLAIEGVLRNYIANKQANGQYFWINPQLNTANLRQGNFGDFGSTILDSTSGTDPVTAAADSIGAYFTNLWSNPALLDTSNLFDPTASYPSDLQPQVTAAAQTDIFGNPAVPWIIGGGAALLLVAILATSGRKSGRRRR